tara:strand:- start:154 stop:540 length:387 start_codon:yes stop_codon:yes gene_type:complete
MDSSKAELLFVYNAKSGVMHTLMDFAHKIISPETYPCSLCSITYGNFGMKKVWADYLNGLPYRYRFFYRDHLGKLPETLSTATLPVIFLRKGDAYKPLLSASELQGAKDAHELCTLLNKKLKTLLGAI